MNCALVLQMVLFSEEIAYTLNITKERANFYTTKYKPQVSLTSNKLQVSTKYLIQSLGIYYY